MTNRLKRLCLKLQELFPWFTAALVALSAGWAGDALQETFNVWLSGTMGVLSLPQCVYILSFLGSAILLYRQRDAFFRPRTRYLKNEAPEQRRHLILFLSNLNTDKGKFNNGVPDGLTLSNNLDVDIKKMEVLKDKKPLLRWPWEMPLRGLRHHFGVLQNVTIVCSKESIEQVDWFLDICKRYDHMKDIIFFLLVKGPTELISTPFGAFDSARGWDFESFDELSDAMWTLIRKLGKQHGIKEREIMIDFTGGQKVTSVVAAAITFNRKIKGQYVQTNKPYEVLGYDAMLATPDTGGLGI
jgi:hypothetical protein